jgi:hypothetical protein
MEEKHVPTYRTKCPPPRRSQAACASPPPLTCLWLGLPESARKQALESLGRVAARHVAFLPRKEVRYDP